MNNDFLCVSIGFGCGLLFAFMLVFQDLQAGRTAIELKQLCEKSLARDEECILIAVEIHEAD